MKRAFTLIELLVVIAIIGVISTLSVVSFSSAREKAKIANGLSFSKSILVSTDGDLVGRWDFDECGTDTTVFDLGETNTNGALSGGAVRSSDTVSAKGCSASFDGIDDSVEIPHHANQLTSSGITISAWIKANTSGENFYGRIVDKSAGTQAENGFSMAIEDYSGNIRTFLKVNGGANAYSSIITPKGKWTHIVATATPSGSIRWYINGALGATVTSGALSGITTTNNLVIGNRSGTTDRTFNGLIDDVRIYSRTLTSYEIRRIFAKELPQHLSKN